MKNSVNNNLILIVGFFLISQTTVFAQQYQVQSFIEYHKEWAGGAELLYFSKEDCVLIVSTDFSSIIKCEIEGNRLTFDFPHEDAEKVFFLLKYNGRYFYTKTLTISKEYLEHIDNIMYFIWVDIDSVDVEDDAKSKWNHYFSVVYDRLSAPGDPVMAEPYFIKNKKVYLKKGERKYLKAKSKLEK